MILYSLPCCAISHVDCPCLMLTKDQSHMDGWLWYSVAVVLHILSPSVYLNCDLTALFEGYVPESFVGQTPKEQPSNRPCKRVLEKHNMAWHVSSSKMGAGTQVWRERKNKRSRCSPACPLSKEIFLNKVLEPHLGPEGIGLVVTRHGDSRVLCQRTEPCAKTRITCQFTRKKRVY